METQEIPHKKDLDKILKEVELKQRMAEQAGIDRLFLDVYHRSLRYYPIWMANESDRKYVYPGVLHATGHVEHGPGGDVFNTEFTIGDRHYKVISKRKGMFTAYDVYYSMELYMNGVKKFALREKHDVRLRGAHYYALNIEAYSGDEWVDDFEDIREYQMRVAQETVEEDKKMEDAELVARLKEDFKIGTLQGFRSTRKPFMLSFWTLVVIGTAVLVLLMAR